MIYLRFLLYLLVKNPAKLIFIVLTLISFEFAGKFNDDKNKDHVLAENLIVQGKDSSYVYLYKDQSVFRVTSFPKKQAILPDQTIEYGSYAAINIVLWIVFGILSIILLASVITNDDDVNWEFRTNWSSFLRKQVKVYEQNGKYHWVLFNKLLVVHEKPIDGYFLSQAIDAYINDPNIYPSFTPLEIKRNDKLNKLGIF
jgi:hypothetical protein